MTCLGCFAGLAGFGGQARRRPSSRTLDNLDSVSFAGAGFAGAQPWETLPPPVSAKELLSWCPLYVCGHVADNPEHQVLFLHLGHFDLRRLDDSGCTRQDLLRLCAAELSGMRLQALTVVADCNGLTLGQLRSSWWELFMPQLLSMVLEHFPGLLQQVAFVRAGRLASISAHRVTAAALGRSCIVLPGDELAAQTALEALGLRCAVDGLYRDPTLSTSASSTSSSPGSASHRKGSLATAILSGSVAGAALAAAAAAAAAACAGEGWAGGSAMAAAAYAMVVALSPGMGTPGTSWDEPRIFSTREGLSWWPFTGGRLHAGGASTTLAAAVSMALPGAAVLVCLWALLVADLLLPEGRTGVASSEAAGGEAAGGEALRGEGHHTGDDEPADKPRPLNAWWPEVRHGEHGEPRFHLGGSGEPERPLEAASRAPDFEGDAQDLLQRLLDVTSTVRQVRRGGKGVAGGLTIQCIVEQPFPLRAVWFAQVPNSSVMFIASEVLLSTPAPPEAVAWAIHSAQERLQWDGASFARYEALHRGRAQPSSRALGDFIYCRIPLVPGVKDRDMVQERFLLELPNEKGYAILIHSCSENQTTALGKPPTRDAIRAKTVLSGYLLRPAPEGHGVLLSGLSQTDIGGNVPQWVQSLVKKAGKHKPIEWALRLEAYCNRKCGVETVSPHSRLLRRWGSWPGGTSWRGTGRANQQNPNGVSACYS